MSTLTKVFVVLLVVFSIFFTVMTVATVARTTNWREVATSYEEHARIADAKLRGLIASNAAELASLRDSLKTQLDRVAELEGQVQQGSSQAAEFEAQLKQAAAEKSSAEAISRGLLAQLQVAEAERAEYRRQRDTLEDGNVDLTRRNIDLNERVNEQIAQIAVLLAEKRQFEQQINILRTENEQLALSARVPSAAAGMEEPHGVAMHGVQAVTPVSATPVRGRVLETSGDLATLSVGSADGVQKGMIFVVHREGTYVADIKISVVDPDQCAGRIVQQQSAPQPGDQVIDASGLGGERG